MTQPIIPCPFADISHLTLPAAREGVTLEPDPATVWFCCSLDGHVVAVGGLRFLTPGMARLRGAFTLPAYRGLGLGEVLSAARVEYARSAGIICLETHSLKPAHYLRLGWVDTGERRPSGAWVLHCVLARAEAARAEAPAIYPPLNEGM